MNASQQCDTSFCLDEHIKAQDEMLARKINAARMIQNGHG